MIDNKYVDMSVQKGGLPRVKGSIEQFEAMLEVLKDSRLKIRDGAVVWLDFANEYGAVPHLFILKALRFVTSRTILSNSFWLIILELMEGFLQGW